MKYAFRVRQRVDVVTVPGATGIVLDRCTNMEAGYLVKLNFYQVAFERLGKWSIEQFPENALASRPFWSRWFERKEKTSEETRPPPEELGGDMELQPGANLPPTR